MFCVNYDSESDYRYQFLAAVAKPLPGSTYHILTMHFPVTINLIIT